MIARRTFLCRAIAAAFAPALPVIAPLPVWRVVDLDDLQWGFDYAAVPDMSAVSRLIVNSRDAALLESFGWSKDRFDVVDVLPRSSP